MKTAKQLTSLLILFLVIANAQAQHKLSFEKIRIDETYVSSSATTADIDKDGLDDIIAGEVWYKAPDWTKYEIRPTGTYSGKLPDQSRTGISYYARSMASYTKDLDNDGWLDVIIFNGQSGPAYWYKNPGQDYDQMWKEYLAIEEFHNEGPQMVDLFGDGVPVALAGNKAGENKYSLAWFSPNEDPAKLFDAHIIGDVNDFEDNKTPFGSHTQFAPGGRGHGLGIGDINGDGNNDILTSQGWYEAPANPKTTENWEFHLFRFDLKAIYGNPARDGNLFSHMFAADFDQDGDNDIIGGAAHDYGLWWYEQVRLAGQIDFLKHEISMDYSQLHSMQEVDLDGDGKKEYLAGKRYLAHLGHDPGSSDPAVLFYVEPVMKDGKVKMNIHIIDEDSGAGTQIWVCDQNKDGKLDIVTSNKKGTHLFLQK
ncbi:MAG: VCBS repeat-containing protein [Balneolaceae bacterium]|nr:VCBS repeat-containing protein [Balneolaceae bacterium]